MNREENKMIEYEIDYRELDAAVFIRFVNEIWPGDYDEMKTRSALSKTMNITPGTMENLVGCLRVLSDGYYFGTITEMLVLPSIKDRVSAAGFLNWQVKNAYNALLRSSAGAGDVLRKERCSRSLTSYTLNEK